MQLQGFEWTLPYATMRDGLPVQLHDTMLSSKQPVSTHEEPLFTVTNHMPAYRSAYSSKNKGCYVQVA